MAQDTGRPTDPEKGTAIQEVTGIITIAWQGFVDSPTWNLDDHPEPSQSARNQPASSRPPKGGSNFGDSSGPIFSMYSKITKEEDDQLAERWQKDADGILIFVSPVSTTFILLRTNITWDHSRPVYSPQQSPHYLPYPSRTSDRALKILPHSTSGISIRFSPTRTLRPALLLSPNSLSSLLRYMLSG